jgi:hypothetical protein
MLADFMAIWSIFCGNLVNFKVIWYIFPALVRCTKKNLAALGLCAALTVNRVAESRRAAVRADLKSE